MSFKIIATLLLAATSALATPAPVDAVTLHEVGASGLNDRSADINMANVSGYTDTACTHLDTSRPGHAQYGPGTVSCFTFANGGPVGTQVKGSGCQTYYYNTPNCASGQFLVPNSGCYANVKSFSIVC